MCKAVYYSLVCNRGNLKTSFLGPRQIEFVYTPTEPVPGQDAERSGALAAPERHVTVPSEGVLA